MLYNDTRWYGKCFMFKRWLELYDHCEKINEDIRRKDGARAKVIPMENAREEVKRYGKILENVSQNALKDAEEAHHAGRLSHGAGWMGCKGCGE